MSYSVYETVHDRKNFVFVRIDENADVETHFHRNIEILYIIEGSVLAEINGVAYEVRQDEILFVPSYSKHNFTKIYDNDKNGYYKKIFIIVPYEICRDFSKFFADKSFEPVLRDASFNRKLLHVIYKMRLDYLDSLNANKDILEYINLSQKGYVNMIVGKLLAHYPLINKTKNSNIDLITGVLSYIDENFKENLTLESLAARFGYNKCYFSKIFNKYVGTNLTSYVNTVRIQHIVSDSKLTDSKQTTALATDYGFDSLTTFYRHFKKIYHDTPSNILL